MAKSGTIVVDNLPAGCTTFHLFAAFRAYGNVLRAWRSHGSQGLVTYQDTKSAITAAKKENGRKIDGRALVVTAAFFDTSDMRSGWWQCTLCRSWNENGSTVCSGYMCGLEDTEGGIGTWNTKADEVGHDEMMYLGSTGVEYAEPAAPEALQSDTTAAQHDMAYYPVQYGDSGVYNQMPYDSPVMEEMPMQQYPAGQQGQAPQDAGYNGQGQGMHAPAQSSVDYQNGYSPAPQGQQPANGGLRAPARSGGAAGGVQPYPAAYECSPELRIVPAQSPLRYHCVLINNVPSNITNQTLKKVFGKFGRIEAWVRPPPGNQPRAIAEGQVLFDSQAAATEAVEGESGHAVDNESIWCTYAAELFVCSVTATATDDYGVEMWNNTLASDDAKALIDEISMVFHDYGLINDVTVSDNKVIFIEYYSLSSLLDAIASEDRNSRAGFTLDVAIATANTRWPCTQQACLRVNYHYATVCESCQSPRQPINARMLRDVIYKSAMEVPAGQFFGDSYQGYCRTLKGYFGRNLPETKPKGMDHRPSGHGGVAGQAHEGGVAPAPPLAAAPADSYHYMPPTAHHDGSDRRQEHSSNTGGSSTGHNPGHWGSKGSKPTASSGASSKGWSGKGGKSSYGQRSGGYRQEFGSFGNGKGAARSGAV